MFSVPFKLFSLKNKKSPNIYFGMFEIKLTRSERNGAILYKKLEIFRHKILINVH